MVPPGNRNAEQPAIPGASVRRTRGTNSTFDRKYQKVRELLATDSRLMSKIKSTARAYGIDPIHIIGALVGEHTYNVDAYDGLQSYYVKAASYAGQSFRFAYSGENIDDFVARPQFDVCKSKGIPTASGPAAKMSGTVLSEARRSTANPSPTIVSARCSSSPSMPARPSASARSIP